MWLVIPDWVNELLLIVDAIDIIFTGGEVPLTFTKFLSLGGRFIPISYMDVLFMKFLVAYFKQDVFVYIDWWLVLVYKEMAKWESLNKRETRAPPFSLKLLL